MRRRAKAIEETAAAGNAVNAPLTADRGEALSAPDSNPAEGGGTGGRRSASADPTTSPAHIPPALAELRRKIDAVDDRLLELISERGRLAAEIGRIKNASGAPIFAPDREKEILDRLRARNTGPFSGRVIEAVYRELISGSFTLERPLRIAYLGPAGSFSHEAAVRRFGASVEFEPVTEIAGAFREVEKGHADFAVVPVENSTGGGVVDTLDAFLGSSARVCTEINHRIHHNLLSRHALADIQRVYSKPEVFDQCRNWLLQTGLYAKIVPAGSSSAAAERAAGETGAAAIASTLAGELYRVPVLFANVEDNPQNVTRFFVLGPRPAPRTGEDKTSLMFGTSHRAGALADVLEIFRRESVSMTMITSRPSRRRNWEYVFFVDVEGHAEDPPVRRAIDAAREFCSDMTILGSYPRAVEPD